MIKKKLLLSILLSGLLVFPILANENPKADNYQKEKIKQISILKEKVSNIAKKMDVKFTKTDIKTVLKFFATEFKLNIISTPEVIGEIDFSLSNINPIDAFDSVLTNYGFDWYVEKDIIKVFSKQPIKIFSLNYASASEVAPNIKAMLSRKGVISINERTNSLVVKAPDTELAKIGPVIKALDSMPRQVLVEVKILEVQAGFSRGIGMDISYSKENGGSYAENKGFSNDPAHPNTGLFVRVLQSDFDALIQTLETKTDLNILAHPKILAINHKKATIITGQRLGYKTSQTAGTTGIVTESVEFLDVGTKLSFTPHISDNNDILMEIKPEVSEGAITDGIPNETTTETDTSVLVKDGQTILIGGLIRKKEIKSKSGLPILSSIPFLDLVSGRNDVTTQKIETIVLIRP
ncbi:type II secretion system protein GspD, partial [Candidatus Margulisiibacteriota bacterium]